MNGNSWLHIGLAGLLSGAAGAFAGDAPRAESAATEAPKWVALWHDAFKGAQVEPDILRRLFGAVMTDRVTGDTYRRSRPAAQHVTPLPGQWP